MRRSNASWLAFIASAAGHSFIPKPHGLTVVPSKLFGDAEISYKRNHICETTKGVASYSGYVKLPQDLLPDSQGWDKGQSANMFFWFFESRNDPANDPLTIFLGGGPGTTSLVMGSGFPCTVNSDANSTTLMEDAWNKKSNLLYIDQPVGTGFSYVNLTTGILDLLTESFIPDDGKSNLPETNVTSVRATVDGQSIMGLPRTTMSAARTMWAFLQVWVNEFPKLRNHKPKISLWTSSYGGFYGPAFFSHFLDQNERICKKTIDVANATKLHLGTLGLLEAVIDARAFAQGYLTFARNNTYGIEIYSEEVYDALHANLTAPETGCYDLVDQCRAQVHMSDPERFGTNQTVNEYCLAATARCFIDIQGAYTALSNRSAFDVTHSKLETTPPPHYADFFNQKWVQAELGVPLNLTLSNPSIVNAFFGMTGDPMVGDYSALEKVLRSDVNVAMAYGDRDYRASWFGGENVSLSMNFPGAEGFRSAGYEPIITNSSYEGGMARQHGKLSFSLIYQAGHGVASYQPSTLARVFERAMFGKDVATGKVKLRNNLAYATKGPSSIDKITSKVPEPQENICFVSQAPVTCTPEQLAALADGTAVVKDWVVVSPRGKKLPSIIG